MFSTQQQTNYSKHLGTILCVSALCAVLGGLWYLVPHPAIPVALAIVPFAILFTLNFPVLLALLFIVFSYFRLHEAFPVLMPLRIPLLLSLATLVTFFWHIAITRNIQFKPSKELKWFAVFFIIVMLGILFAGNKTASINYFTSTYVKIAIMTPVLSWILTQPNHFKLAIRLFCIAGGLVAFVAISNKLAGIGLVEGTRVTIGRSFQSVLGDPNDLSLVLLFPFSFALALVMAPGMNRYERVFGAITSVLIVWAIIATQSRGGLLGIASVLGIFAYRRVKSKALLFSGGGVLMVILYFAAGISGRKSGGAAEEGIDESAMGRIHAWEAAFKMALDNPVTGVGIDNYFYNYYFYSSYWDGKNHAVHSTWFGVLGETGFVGLFVFLAMVITMYKTAIYSLRKVSENVDRFPPVTYAMSEGTLAGIIAFSVSGSFLTQGFTWPVYILVALTAANYHFVKQHGEKNHGE
ncbi:O-antigen ligase family protein [Vibrio nigripulchritudo]|uniref:O-antigen ligase family protein n=1 Tax=Vibrio nigripulchritudo TaxID=28173 RepID=UPI0005F9B66B|nr:O-antigen ligase family protein [Vibrio nigripulchritudo]KJY76529.1 membrane protein [Vibrio nigripulchritudo]